MLETEVKKLTLAVTELTASLNMSRQPVTEAEPVRSATAATQLAPASMPGGPTAAAAPAAGAAVVVIEPVTDQNITITKKQLVEKFIELAQAKGREVALALLAEYKISKLPELKDKALWPAFVAECDKLLAG